MRGAAGLILLLAAGCGDGFVPDGACASCHAQQHDEWSRSHHALAMQEATEATVLGDFDEAPFLRRDGRFLVRADGREHEVRYAFGVEPLQQYLLEAPDGRLQAFGTAWDTEREEWFEIYPGETFRPGDSFHWTGWRQNAEIGCIECHVTGFRMTPDAEWSAPNVGCQACHGPAADHVADPGPLPPTSVETCAPCHSLRRPLLPDPAQAAFADAFELEPLVPGAYFPDGQILGEVFEYGSFVQSRMYREGVRCIDCHPPHGLGERLVGNALCEQCHHPDAPLDRFPTLRAKDYDAPAHHFHEDARCVDCHMTERTYMQVDGRRDHSFRIPRPDVSAKVGSPDACTSCHADQSQAWAAERIVEWYGPDREPHFGEALASGGPEALRALARDSGQPEIVRATAERLLGRPGRPGVARPGSPEGPFNQGAFHAASGDLERAARDYRDALAIDPGFLPASLNLAVLLDRIGETAGAESVLRGALRFHPDSGDVHFSLALALAATGRRDEARSHLDRAAELLPDDPRVRRNRALLGR